MFLRFAQDDRIVVKEFPQHGIVIRRGRTPNDEVYFIVERGEDGEGPQKLYYSPGLKGFIIPGQGFKSNWIIDVPRQWVPKEVIDWLYNQRLMRWRGVDEPETGEEPHG